MKKVGLLNLCQRDRQEVDYYIEFGIMEKVELSAGELSAKLDDLIRKLKALYDAPPPPFLLLYQCIDPIHSHTLFHLLL